MKTKGLRNDKFNRNENVYTMYTLYKLKNDLECTTGVEKRKTKSIF